MLLGCRYQRGINDLAPPGHIPVLQDLLLDCREQRFGTGYANTVFKVPDGRAIRKTCSIHQTAKPLIAMAIQQLILHLLV